MRIAFGAAGSALGEFLFARRGATVHIAGNLSSNYWNGNRRPQFRVVDAAAA